MKISNINIGGKVGKLQITDSMIEELEKVAEKTKKLFVK